MLLGNRRAKDYHYRALKLHEGLDDNADAMANTYSNLGRLYKSLGNLARAEALFLDALNLRQGLGSRHARQVSAGLKPDDY
jgi:tetratricopeptide (TPR) repeat protein